MTREQIFDLCVNKIDQTNSLLMELATGTGKTRLSIILVNHLLSQQPLCNRHQPINILILVAKRVHKQTWQEEIEKWGGIHHSDASVNICMECYESLKKHAGEKWTIVLGDEVHHIASETRMALLNQVTWDYFIGLSATIPKKVKQYFRFRYHSEIVSCNLTEAITSEILPEPQILLFPLMLDNRAETESWEFHPKAPGPIIHAPYRECRKYKFNSNVHSIISMTQKQKCMEYDNLIEFFKKKSDSSIAAKRSWLFQAGKRLEFLADIKLPIIKDILHHLDKHRTITFCKTIGQAEAAGKWCIHSQNKNAQHTYEMFNQKRISHITAVNILNENANLVDCKYAIFCNLSSSEIQVFQRLGRSLRHKSPVIIIPYYQGTREQELVEKMVEGFNKDHIKTIHSIQEI